MDPEETKEVQEERIETTRPRSTGEGLKSQLTWSYKPEKHYGTQSQRTRRGKRKRDYQTVSAGKNYVITKYFQERFTERVEAPSSWKIVKLVFLRKPHEKPQNRKKKLEGHRVDIGGVKVVRIVCYCSSGKEKEPEGWRLLHVGCIDGISCQHHQVHLVPNCTILLYIPIRRRLCPKHTYDCASPTCVSILCGCAGQC